MNAALIRSSSLIVKEEMYPNHCWDKSAGVKSRVNYDMKIILSFSSPALYVHFCTVGSRERTWMLHNRVSGSIKQLFPTEMYFL